LKVHVHIIAISLFLLLSVPIAWAHTPFGSSNENNTIANAIEFSNPTKSWTMYRELHEAQEVEYYKLHLKPGEKFQFSVSTPRSADPSFVPSAVVMWPGSANRSNIPTFVEVPAGYSATLVRGVRPPSPEYEAFTPTSYYFVVEYAQPVQREGDYYFAVYAPNSGGKYNLAVGYVEEFTVVEWLKIPFDVLNIHIWEGQSLLMILAPLLLALIIGFPSIQNRYKLSLGLVTALGMIAGLLDIGTGMMTLFQMLLAANGATQTVMVPLTLVFAVIPLVLGVLLLRKTINHKAGWSIKDRLTLVVFGALGLVFWAGLIAGPILTMALGLMPPRRR